MMNETAGSYTLEVEATRGRCPIGETVGRRNREEGSTPVFSCEGACIRGEIARLAANQVARKPPYRRGCHGELLTVPHSAIARWVREADRVIVVDGCFLRCHARVMRGLIEPGRLVEIDALSHYRKYDDIFDIDDVPEEERRQVARAVAEWILADPVAASAAKKPCRGEAACRPLDCPERPGSGSARS